MTADPVLFGLDGVLVDSRAAISTCINAALIEAGVGPLPAEELFAYIGAPLHASLAELLERHGADPALADACLVTYRDRYRTVSVEAARPVEGMDAVVRRLAGRRPLAVVTSKPVEFAIPILDACGLTRSFQVAVGPALDALAEPKVDTVGRALDLLGVRSPATVLVGDREHDIAAGRAHGLTTVGVTWGIGSAAELRAAGAGHLVDEPTALLALLTR